MYGTQQNYEQLPQRGIKPYLKKRRGKDSPGTHWLRCLPTQCSLSRALYLQGRRRVVAEGSFAEAHTQHGHWRCRWRRRWRVQIQCYLVAINQNIKKLVRYGQPQRKRPAQRLAIGRAGAGVVAAWSSAHGVRSGRLQRVQRYLGRSVGRRWSRR
jgi:hypothetical protein